MPVITDIQRQKRNEQRYSIYIDGKYSLSLSDLDLSTSGLRIGQELSDGAIEALQTASIEGKAYNQVVGYISYRRRSRREVESYLKRKEFEPEMVASIVSRLEAVGLVDDRAFANAWIADRRALRPRSARMLAQELAAKGLSRELIDESLAESAEDPTDTVVAMITRKQLLTKYADDQKLIGYLARQGFGYREIKEALARLRAS